VTTAVSCWAEIDGIMGRRTEPALWASGWQPTRTVQDMGWTSHQPRAGRTRRFTQPVVSVTFSH
jgi:hypothetical protein